MPLTPSGIGHCRYEVYCDQITVGITAYNYGYEVDTHLRIFAVERQWTITCARRYGVNASKCGAGIDTGHTVD